MPSRKCLTPQNYQKIPHPEDTKARGAEEKLYQITVPK